MRKIGNCKTGVKKHWKLERFSYKYFCTPPNCTFFLAKSPAHKFKEALLEIDLTRLPVTIPNLHACRCHLAFPGLCAHRTSCHTMPCCATWGHSAMFVMVTQPLPETWRGVQSLLGHSLAGLMKAKAPVQRPPKNINHWKFRTLNPTWLSAYSSPLNEEHSVMLPCRWVWEACGKGGGKRWNLFCRPWRQKKKADPQGKSGPRQCISAKPGFKVLRAINYPSQT